MLLHGVFIAFAALFVKHFVVDFLLQPRWMFANKHRFAHPGGLAHAGFHGLVTGFILYGLFRYGIVGPTTQSNMVVWLALMEFFAHYWIDWTKMNACILCGWRPNTHPAFWYALGADQMAHNLTYVAILWFWFS